jgi:hypothetical protein
MSTPMRFRAGSVFFIAAAVWAAAQIASAPSAHAYLWCADSRVRPGELCMQRCWVTESGLGVCDPGPYDRPQAAPARRRALAARRY